MTKQIISTFRGLNTVEIASNGGNATQFIDMDLEINDKADHISLQRVKNCGNSIAKQKFDTVYRYRSEINEQAKQIISTFRGSNTVEIASQSGNSTQLIDIDLKIYDRVLIRSYRL